MQRRQNRGRNDRHKQAQEIDSKLNETRDAIAGVKANISSGIDSHIAEATAATNEIKTAIETAIVERMSDATDEVYSAVSNIDNAATAATMQAYWAAKQAGAALPDMPLESVEQSGFAASMPTRKIDPDEHLPTKDTQFGNDLPSKPTLEACQRWNQSPEGIASDYYYDSNCVMQCKTDRPRQCNQPESEGTGAKDPLNILPVKPPQNLLPQKPQPGGQIKPLEIPAVCDRPVVLHLESPKIPPCPPPPAPPNITVNLPAPIVNVTIDGDETTLTVPPPPPPTPGPPPTTIVSTPPATEMPPPFQGIQDCPAPPQIQFAPPVPDLPAVVIRTDITFDALQPTKCIASDRLYALKEACIKFGKIIMQFPDKVGEGNFAANMLINLQRKYWGNYGELHKEYEEKVKNYLQSKGMIDGIESWHDALTSALGTASEEVRYIAASRAFLQSCALSFMSLKSEGEYSGVSKESGKIAVNVGTGLSIPFMNQAMTTGTGAVTTGEKGLEKSYKADAGFNLGITVAPFIAPLISAVDQILDGAAGINCLTSEQAMQAYLRGGMSYDCFQRIVELMGGDMSEWEMLTWTSAERLNTGEIFAAWRRAIIDDKQRDTLLRRLGWLSQKQANIALQLTDYIPGPSDLIRFMVRDVADTSIVQQFNLDAEFEDKWKGNVKKDGFAQGISDETARNYWRAHWDLPGMRSVYEALHRFRDDGSYDGPRDLQTSASEVEKILAYNDMLPVWRKRLVELSYDPLTRVDAQRAYMLGVIDKDRLYKAFRDIGYDQANAETLVAFTQTRRETYLLALRPSKYYRDGYITSDQLRKRIAKYKVSEDEFRELVFDLELQANAALAKACITEMKRRYMHGVYTKSEAREELLRRGYSVEHSDRLVTAWDCMRDARSREVSAVQLCKFASEGLIGQYDYQSRLVKLGYTQNDAGLLAESCKNAALSKEARAKRMDEKAKLQQQVDADKLAEKEAIGETELEVKAKEKAAKNAKAEALRRKQLRNAAFDLAMRVDVDIVAGTELVDSMVTATILNLGISRHEAETIVINAVKHFKKSPGRDFEEYMERYWEADSRLSKDDEGNG